MGFLTQKWSDFFFCVILVVHVGHGMFHPVAASVFSKSVFERGLKSSECGGDIRKHVVRLYRSTPPCSVSTCRPGWFLGASSAGSTRFKLGYYFLTSSCLLPIIYGRRLRRGRAMLLTVLQRPRTQTENRRTKCGMVAHLSVNCCHSSSLAITKRSERRNRTPSRPH